VLEAAMVTAAKEKPLNDGKRRGGLFIAAQAGPMPLIAKRNGALRVLRCTWTPAAKGAVRGARKELKWEVGAAKAMQMRETIGTIQPPGDGRPVTPKTARNATRLLTRGPNARKDQSAGSGSGKCTTPEENREVIVGSLRKTFSQVGTSGPTAVAKVYQRPQQP